MRVSDQAVQRGWRVVEIAVALWVGWEIVKLLERDEKKILRNQVIALARQRSGRTMGEVVKRFNRALHEKWWTVTRWSVERRAKRKGLTKAQIEYRALTKVYKPQASKQ